MSALPTTGLQRGIRASFGSDADGCRRAGSEGRGARREGQIRKADASLPLPRPSPLIPGLSLKGRVLDEPATNGTRSGWADRLRARGYALRGHRLVRDRS
jgi:hypothetical protein